MFPLRDFLKRHGQIRILGTVLGELNGLLPNLPEPSNDAGVEVFKANKDGEKGGLFEIRQDGYDQRNAWKADIVILPDSITAVLLNTAKDERSATTVLVASITSATFRPGNICQEETHSVED